MTSTNAGRAKKALQLLKGLNCSEVVVCAGARNAPLVVALDACPDFKVWNFFEERSASFFALGRIKSLGAPVAVVTTSGTACAELLPAVIEADYTGLPLVVVTADRPRAYRGRGAPQSIEQVGLFSHYVEKTWDYEGELTGLAWSARRPAHFNICLTEPKREELDEIEKTCGESLPSEPIARIAPTALGASSLEDFKKKCRNPVVIAGPMSPDQALAAKEWLARTRLPVYIESLSNLCDPRSLKEQIIRGDGRSILWTFRHGLVDGVIRIGGVPTTRLWRDLEGELRDVPVLSFGDRRFAGLGRPDAVAMDFEMLNRFNLDPGPAMGEAWLELQDSAFRHLHKLLHALPLSEPALLAGLAARIEDSARIFLGNSLPVREWDLVVTNRPDWRLSGNRGANGIDGQVSTFLGYSEPGDSNWAVVGDLTALYDLSAPWILNQRALPKLRIVVVNNGGGRIFSRMFGRENLENPHHIGFEHWARMWNLRHRLCRRIEDLDFSQDAGPLVVELVPDLKQSEDFNEEWDRFWRTQLI